LGCSAILRIAWFSPEIARVIGLALAHPSSSNPFCPGAEQLYPIAPFDALERKAS
jgi:hypothetical protein